MPISSFMRAAARRVATALALAGFEANVIEMSWYGTKTVAVPLGEAFHPGG